MRLPFSFFQVYHPFLESFLLQILLVCSICLVSCSKSDDTAKIPGEKPLYASEPLLKLLKAEDTGVDFVNHIEESFQINITNHVNTSNGGGVAIFDANNDGLPDLYFISNTGENKFYVNKGQFRFEDATTSAGLVSTGGFEIAVTAVDINVDGFLDLYVCRAGPIEDENRRNKLFINNGDLTFTDQAKLYGIADKSASSGANFFDYDLDGDLDLYLLNYPVDFSYTNKVMVRPTADSSTVEPILDPIGPYDSDRLYRNDGPPKEDGTGGFKDVSRSAGIWEFGYGLSVSVEDFNRDGWPDVYVANDFIQPDRLFINNQNGTFTDKLKDYFKHISQHTMGTDLNDMDNDGLFDLFGVDMMSNTHYRRKTVVSSNSQNTYKNLIQHNYFPPVVRNVLQRNNGNSTFSDIACMAGVYQTDWSWSCLMADLDNDSWKDFLVTNGYVRELTNKDFIDFTFADIKAKGNLESQFKDVQDFLKLIPQFKVRNFVFQNNKDLTFEDKSGSWMTMLPSWSNGAATGDLDQDGDLDFVVNNIDDKAFVYENVASQSLKNNYLQFTCIGPSSNPKGVGTSIILYDDTLRQYQYLNPTRGIFSSVEHLLHFGLGEDTHVDSIRVTWPDGKSQILKDLKSNQRIQLKYADASKHENITKPGKEFFTDVTKATKLSYRHFENTYNDFEITFLLPWTLSDLGPLMATADVNHDGWTDVYIGNAFNESRGLFTMNGQGTFDKICPQEWEADSMYEDHGAMFFDADMDNDMDLLVVSGGYESTYPQAWQTRLYINLAPNTFKHAKGAIPLLDGVCLRAASYDYDADGDIDIFLGGRVSPGKYPLAPSSYVLRNDRNKFVDVTNEVAPEFAKIGMVSDLQFGNVDNDPALELIVAGEWMPISVFNIENGKLKLADPDKLGLAYSNGFWNRFILSDLDKDGDVDIVAGNLGLNSHYEATQEHPLQCYAADFDLNGSIDPIITFFEGSSCYPIIQKDVMLKQIPMLKKKYIYFKDYAAATITDVFSGEQLKKAQVLNAYILETGWWENQSGKFVFHPLPFQAQVSPVNGIIVRDFDNDGNEDIFVAGNKYGMEVETGRLDAGVGAYFRGDSKGSFKWINNLETGLWASKEVRDLAFLSGPEGQQMILVSNNNDAVQVYKK